MAEIAVRPRGPYSLALSARLAGDATRRVREGLVTARCCGAVARAWQSPDGTVTIRSESAAAAEKLRWMLALDDDHSEFLRRFADDPLLGRATKHLRGLPAGAYGDRRAGTPPRRLRTAHRLEDGTKARAVA